MLNPNEASITFAVPYYSKPELLIETVQSVLKQSRPNWLLNIYDDNPDVPLDPDLIATYLKDPRVNYHLNSSNLGISGNWNQCLANAHTELVTILHSDDCLLPHYIDVVTRLMGNKPNSIAYFCQAQVVDEDGETHFSVVDHVKSHLRAKLPGNDLSGQSGVTSLLKGNHVICPTVCYRKSALGQQHFDSQWRFVLDLEFFIRLMIAGATISGTDEFAYVYRRHRESQTSILSQNMTRFEEEISYYESMVTILNEHDWKAAAETARRKSIIKLHLIYLILTDLLQFRFSLVKKRIAVLSKA